MPALPASLSSLSQPAYRRFLPAQFIGSTGVWMQRIAQDWLILELTGSAAAVGLVVAMQFAPVLLLSLWAGVIVDRFPKRTLLVITQSTAAAMALLLGTLTLTGVVQAWMVFSIALVLGLVTVVDGPARQSMVADIVGPTHIRNAVSLNSSVFQFSGIIGPALSGTLVHAVGQGWSFLLNGAACAAVATIIFSIRPTSATIAAPGERRPNGGLRAGLAYIRRTKEVFWAIGLVALAGLFAFNLPVLLAAMADTEFRTGVSGYSLLTTLNAVGALGGGIWSARRTSTSRLRGLAAGLGMLGLLYALMALVPGQPLFAVLLVAAGFCALMFLIGANSMVQLTAAPEYRGRVMSVYIMVLLGGQSIAGPLIGRFSDAHGPRSAMLLCGIAIVALSAALALLIARQAHLRIGLQQGRRVRRPQIVPR